MENKIAKHIIELLKDNECVIIPGFGGFILKPLSASINNNIFTPAHKEIGFNKSLVADDGLLTGALMGSEKFDYSKAQNEVNKFSNNLSFMLKRDKEYSLEGLGKFFITANENLKFNPLQISHIDKASYGFKNISAQPIQREIVKNKPYKAKTASKSNSKNLQGALLAIVVLCMALVSLIFTDTTIKPLHLQNADFLSVFFNENTSTKPSKIAFVPSVKASLTNPVEQRFEEYTVEKTEASYEYLSVQNSEIPKGFYVVVGSYGSKNNAERKESELFSQGKDSYIIEAKNGFFRVVIFAGENYTSGANSLHKIKSDLPDSWMIKNI